MEIFNIHIFEFMLIAGLALVVFGPERLPEVGRFVGKQVARFLAWQQQSPELRMINDVRGEFEREIASLRDELVRTRSQLDVSKNISEVQSELKSALDLRGEVKAAADAAKGALSPAAEPTIAPPQPAPAATTAAAEATQASAEAAQQAADAALKAAEIAADAAETAIDAAEVAETAIPAPAEPVPPPAPPGAVPASARPNKIAGTQPTSVFARPPADELPPLPAHRRNLHDAAPRDEPTPPAGPAAPLSEDERARLIGRVERLSAELQALVGELQERGMIGPDWQPPAQANAQESITR